MSKAVDDVLAERQRQQDKEGWTAAHDDTHTDGSLMHAAVCYAHFGLKYETPPPSWPRSWATKSWKPKDLRSNLVRAAALLIAEIERLDRAEGKGGKMKTPKVEDFEIDLTNAC